MKKKFLSLSLFVLLTLSLAACNLPLNSAENGISMDEQAGTLVAQTLTAAVEQMPTETQAPANTPTKAQPTVTPAPSLTPTATVQPSVAKKPSLQNYNFTCAWNGANLDMNVTMLWTDNADNEQGYYVYRNSEQIANLAPNSGQFIDLYAVDADVNVTYSIEAYNNLGRSEQISFSVKCE